MQTLLFTLAAALSTLARQDAPAPAAEEVTFLRLYEGGILWGRIDSHDDQGLVFLRLDNGGRVRLPWSRLDPAQAEGFLAAFGYVERSEEELTLEADRLVLDDGTEQVGRIVNRTADEIWLKTASALVKIPKLRLRGAATVVQALALDVYTGEELYQQELARLPADDAPGHFELARFCERILEYERAVEHYRRAAQLDATYHADELPNRLARAEERARNRAQVEYLRQIDMLRGRGRFDQALAMAGAFEEAFPGSALAREAQRKLKQIERTREAALRDRTPRAWHAWVGRLAQQKARDPELSLEAALSWVEEALSEEVLTAVHKELSATLSQTVTAEEVSRFWAERKGGSMHKASYGEGTWLLGPQEARAGLAEEPVQAGPTTETERERAKIETRVKRYLENQTVMRTAKAEAGQEDERQSFWEGWSALERKQWMVARFAEKSGDMRVVRIDLTECQQCGGTGVREEVNINAAPSRPGQQGGGGNVIEKKACPLCRNVGVVRRVVYR